jgi:hypothetical protein
MAEAARAAGLQVVTNPEGSKLISGIALARSSQTILSGFPQNGSVLCRSAILENFPERCARPSESTITSLTILKFIVPAGLFLRGQRESQNPVAA